MKKCYSGTELLTVLCKIPTLCEIPTLCDGLYIYNVSVPEMERKVPIWNTSTQYGTL